ncbi:MAG: hypothetical protein LBM73_03530 [Candidatus Nomurabacteria bacterium]|jgi:hypothetical protein|nr:hypothetical protein [Candidatus Nomurabacteria bacterium]
MTRYEFFLKDIEEICLHIIKIGTFSDIEIESEAWTDLYNAIYDTIQTDDLATIRKVPRSAGYDRLIDEYNKEHPDSLSV